MNRPTSKQPSTNQGNSKMTSNVRKTKKRGCGCGRNKAFEESIKKNRKE